MKLDVNSTIQGDLSKLINKASGVIPSKVSELIADLKLSLGQKLEASVSRITLITTEERTLLAKLNIQENSAPEIKARWTSLLANPDLKHIELQLNKKLIQTLTTAPVTKGQLIKLNVTINGLEVVVDSKSPKVSTIKSTSISAPTIHNEERPVSPQTPPPKDSSQVQYEQLLKPKSKSILKPLKLDSKGILPKTTDQASGTSPVIKPAHLTKLDSLTRQDLINLLKTSTDVQVQLSRKPTHPTDSVIRGPLSKALPLSSKQSVVLSIFDKLAAAVEHAPKNNRNKAMDQLVKTLEAFSAKHSINIPSPKAAIPSNKVIKDIIQRSGTFYEHQSIRSPTQAPRASSVQSTAAIIENDLKGAFIQLSQWLNQVQNIVPPTNKAAPDDVLAKIWLNILMSAHSGHVIKDSPSEAKNVYQSILQLIQHSIARIQVQQYRTISSQSHEPSSTSNAFHLDIPVKTPEGYSNIYMQLFEPREKTDEKREKSDKKTRKKAKWRVFMEMELGDEGVFSVELSVCDKKMGATFWAESEGVREKAESHIQQLRQDLESKGLEVTDLRCSQNAPPRQDVKMDFSLIDVQT